MIVLLEFHDFMSTQPDSAEVDLGKQEEFWPLLVMLGQERYGYLSEMANPFSADSILVMLQLHFLQG